MSVDGHTRPQMAGVAATTQEHHAPSVRHGRESKQTAPACDPVDAFTCHLAGHESHSSAHRTLDNRRKPYATPNTRHTKCTHVTPSHTRMSMVSDRTAPSQEPGQPVTDMYSRETTWAVHVAPVEPSTEPHTTVVHAIPSRMRNGRWDDSFHRHSYLRPRGAGGIGDESLPTETMQRTNQ